MLWWVVEFYGCDAELDAFTNLDFLLTVSFFYEMVGCLCCVLCVRDGRG